MLVEEASKPEPKQQNQPQNGRNHNNNHNIATIMAKRKGILTISNPTMMKTMEVIGRVK